MAKLQNALVVAEAVLAVLLVAGVLIQTPKASGLGGTIGGGGNPNGRIADALKNTFGGYDAFKELLQKTAVGQFGSGWAWLVADRAGKLAVKGYPNQDSPYMDELTPLLGVDVWEHAYYLKYQNRRADYVTAWFNTLNWDAINARFGSVWA